ncbi:hypothetical protein KP509_20G060800 [Ceratopteris richardii]|uniref:Uncharacterized protein n=1 Tax=Ceratopteris richardii TaxID=49495 RepID=A0A8T2SJ35_CERRI|nr:hypothetical protein KP509_20G060800 [Ceratopteris richardii]
MIPTSSQMECLCLAPQPICSFQFLFLIRSLGLCFSYPVVSFDVVPSPDGQQTNLGPFEISQRGEEQSSNVMIFSKQKNFSRRFDRYSKKNRDMKRSCKYKSES